MKSMIDADVLSLDPEHRLALSLASDLMVGSRRRAGLLTDEGAAPDGTALLLCKIPPGGVLHDTATEPPTR